MRTKQLVSNKLDKIGRACLFSTIPETSERGFNSKSLLIFIFIVFSLYK